MNISLNAQNTQNVTRRPHEAQEEGRPKSGYFVPYWKVDQNTHDSHLANRMNTGYPMEHLEKGPKCLKRFVDLQEEQKYVPTSTTRAPTQKMMTISDIN